MGFTDKFKGLFWNGEGQAVGPAANLAPAAVQPDDPDAPDLDELAREAAARGTTPRDPAAATPAEPAASAAPAPPAGDLDFAAIYTRTDSAGDPTVDQILTAFEAMRSAMPAPQLAVAIHATAKAIGAEPRAIVTTLGARLAALDATVSDERRKAAEREAARTAELETTTRKVHQEIEAMEHRIAAFRQQLAAATEGVQRRTTGERNVIAAFCTQARGEADRLKALRDFLAPPGAPASPAASPRT